MKARGIVFEKPFGSCGERLPHPIRVRLIDGPNADPDGAGFCLLGSAPVGSTVTVEYATDDQFARLVSETDSREPAGARTARAGRGSAPERASNEVSHWTAEDIEGSCPVCEALAVVELPARLQARQPDETTHVCHPAFDGCNAGFAAD